LSSLLASYSYKIQNGKVANNLDSENGKDYKDAQKNDFLLLTIDKEHKYTGFQSGKE